jgi:hypothetical protein
VDDHRRRYHRHHLVESQPQRAPSEGDPHVEAEAVAEMELVTTTTKTTTKSCTETKGSTTLRIAERKTRMKRTTRRMMEVE